MPGDDQWAAGSARTVREVAGGDISPLIASRAIAQALGKVDGIILLDSAYGVRSTCSLSSSLNCPSKIHQWDRPYRSTC